MKPETPIEKYLCEKRHDMTDKKTNPTCPCQKNSCPRHGNCKACRKHHAKSKYPKPVYCDKKISLREIRRCKA